jgi:hypothetical protein
MAPELRVSNLNCNDLPEASIVGGSGPLSRRLGYRSDRAKFRMKSLVLPTLSEILDEVNDLPVSLTSSEQPLPSWPCPACTFVNSGLLVKCEVCDTPFSNTAAVIGGFIECAVDKTVNAEQESIEVEEEVLVQDGFWPSLREAVHSFVDCEISSVGSSWQDVGDVADFQDDDSDIVIVNLSQKPTVPPSWASRAESISTIGPAVSIPAAGVAAPPLKRAQPRKAGTPKENEPQSDTNWELDELEDRRLCFRQQRNQSPPHGQRQRRTKR